MVVDRTSVLIVFLRLFIVYLMYLARSRRYNADFFRGYLSFFFFFLGFVLYLCFASHKGKWTLLIPPVWASPTVQLVHQYNGSYSLKVTDRWDHKYVL